MSTHSAEPAANRATSDKANRNLTSIRPSFIVKDLQTSITYYRERVALTCWSSSPGARAGPKRALFGVALFVAGGASNLVDRITYGMVIDFMNDGIGSVRTGIFNVADMAIMLGAVILVLEGRRFGGHALREDFDSK